MNIHLRNGFRAGIIFGIVLLFLVLIGFPSTVSDIFGTMLNNETSKPIFGLTPSMFNMLIFFGLVGLWAGASGVRPVKATGKLFSLAGGIISGGLAGLMVGLLIYIIGSLDTAGIKMSTYLAQLLPDEIHLFTLQQSSVRAGMIYFIFLLVTGAIGAMLAILLGQGNWRAIVTDGWNSSRHQLAEQPWARSKSTKYILYGLLIVFVFLIPLRMDPSWIYTAGTVGIYVLLGLGLNIVVGLAGLLDLGYVAFFAIGAYTMALLTAPAPQHLLWNFWIVIPIGIILASSAGVLLGIPVLRMRGDYLAIVTLGFGEIIRILISSDMLTAFSGGPKGVPKIGQPTLFGKPFSSSLDFLYMIMLAAVLIIFVTNRLKDSRVGRAWESMREDETVARAMGINTLQHKLLAFAIGAAFAGLGGALFASRNQFTGPEDHTLMVSINVLCLVIVGGMGSIPGVIAGAFVLKGLPEILRQLENYRIVTFGALLVVMMILRPEGIIPSSRRRMEMQKQEEAPPPIPIKEEVPTEDMVTK
jgi:ABC-type branched-subunit amino acid transport system permease subunit